MTGRDVNQFPKTCQTMAQYVQFIAKRVVLTTNYKNQIILVTTWDFLGVAAKVLIPRKVSTHSFYTGALNCFPLWYKPLS